MNALPPFLVSPSEANATLAAVLRARLPGLSWKQVRALVTARRVKVCNELCLDPARRLREGNSVELLARSAPRPRQPEMIVIRHLDDEVVVVEKPSGLCTVRHPSERKWSEDRKELSPTLVDLVPRLIAAREGRQGPRLRVVQRLDKETSGLLVFARTVNAERELGRQFHAHTVLRRYLAIVPGQLPAQRIHTFLVRDRGDGRRGSTTIPGVGKEAITHVEIVEELSAHTIVRCRLETGRTHQIRIHLAEHGHPICGERVYNHLRDGTVFADTSAAPRLALHAAELGFRHPTTGQDVSWEMVWPADLSRFVESLRRRERDAHRDQMDR
jgi:23S rRNA pseudouridine1911/1915/1917 synthase